MAENIKKAITLLQIARDLIEDQAQWEQVGADRTDMLESAEDLGPILHTLESFGSGLRRNRGADPV